MRTVFLLLMLVLGVVIAAAVFFRVVPMPADTWHVDPLTADAPDSPNFALLRGEDAPLIAVPLAELAPRLDALAIAEGATAIAGSAAEGYVSYVVRTPLMGYPDAISIRLVPEGEGAATRLHIFSRSRFGHSDLGVNAARVDLWLAGLQP